MSDLKIKISAQDSASKVLADVRDSMTRLEDVSSKVGAALGLIGVAGIGGLVATVRAAVDGVDAFNDLSDATGSSIENISALDDIAQRTGTSFGTVESALIKFNTALKDAKPGSDAESAINALGLSVKELKDLDPAQALLKTSQALAGFADDANKARLVQELFGKSLKEVSPFLKDLAEKGELVAKVTTEQAAEAEKFNKQLFELQTNTANAARSLSIGLVTAINDTIRAFREGREAGQSFFEIANNRYWENVSKFYGTAGDAADGYRKRLAEIDQQLSGGESRLLVRNALLREQAQLQAKLAATPVAAAVDQTGAEDARLGRKRSLGTVTATDSGKSNGSAAREALAAAKRAQDERIKAGRELATAIGNAVVEGNDMYAKLQAEEARIAEADAKRTADYLRGLQDELEALAKGNEAQAQQIEEIGLTTDELNKLRLSRQDATIAQLEATRATAEANGLSYEEISILEQKIDLLKQQREITASGQARQAAADTKQEQDRASKEYADTLKNDLKGAFSAAFRDSSGDPLKAFGDALENIMFTRAATALSEAAFESLDAYFGSGSSGSGGGIGDLLAGIFSFDGGGSTGNGSRTGGLDGKGGFMALLHPQETVLDHTKGQTGTGGGAVTVVQNINIDSRSDQATILAAMEQAKQSTLATIQQSRRAGGVYA